MHKLKKHLTIVNIFSSILLQVVTVICGFVIPRITLSVFGSETNGLVNSLGQFLSYISLIEGGIGGVVMAALYKPLVDKDEKKLSSVVKTARIFYQRIALILTIYTLGLAVLYPIFVKSSFSVSYVFSMALILAVNLFMQYNFSLSQQQLLKADKKLYIVAFTQSLILILNTILFVVISKFLPNIHVLKAVTAIVYLLQPISFNHFVRKYYNIDENVEPDKSLLKSRWDGFAINVAAFIHNSTDITILTIFTNLKIVSVYSIYALVSNGLKRVLQSISSAISPNIGHLYAKGDKEALNKKFNDVEFATLALTFFLFTVGGLLITPFVLLYTHNISDANYNQLLFGIILIHAEFIYCIREPYVNLAYSANRFKDIKKHAYIEAFLNIAISIVLVNMIGLVGVAIGTLVAMTYRTIYQVIYLKKHILHRKISIFVKKFVVFALATARSVFICVFFFPMQEGILLFLVNALLYANVTAFFYLIASALFFRKELRELKLL